MRVAPEDEHEAAVDGGGVQVARAGAPRQLLPLELQMVKRQKSVGQLSHAAGQTAVATVHEDQVGSLVQHGTVPVTALHGVAAGLNDGPLLVAEVILLHGVQVAQAGAVPEYDDHPVLHHRGSVARAVDLSTQLTASQ